MIPVWKRPKTVSLKGKSERIRPGVVMSIQSNCRRVLAYKKISTEFKWEVEIWKWVSKKEAIKCADRVWHALHCVGFSLHFALSSCLLFLYLYSLPSLSLSPHSIVLSGHPSSFFFKVAKTVPFLPPTGSLRVSFSLWRRKKNAQVYCKYFITLKDNSPHRIVWLPESKYYLVLYFQVK